MRSSTQLLERGQIVIHATEVERTRRRSPTSRRTLVIADTRDQVAALNAAIRDHRLATGERPAAALGERADELTTRRASGSASATGSPPDATTATSASPTATRWTVTGIGERRQPATSPAAPAQRALPADVRPRARRARLRHHRLRRPGRDRRPAHLAARRDHRRRRGVRRHDPRPPPQHRPPRRRDPRRGPHPMGRRLQPRPRRPRPRPRRRERRGGHRPLRTQGAATSSPPALQAAALRERPAPPSPQPIPASAAGRRAGSAADRASSRQVIARSGPR